MLLQYFSSLLHVVTAYLWPNYVLTTSLWLGSFPCSDYQPGCYVCTLMFIFYKVLSVMPLNRVLDRSNIRCLLFYVSLLLLCYHARSSLHGRYNTARESKPLVIELLILKGLTVVHGITTLWHIGLFDDLFTMGSQHRLPTKRGIWSNQENKNLVASFPHFCHVFI